MNKSGRVYVAGLDNFLGEALAARLLAEDYSLVDEGHPASVDLTDAAAVDDFFTETRPDYVFLVAGKSGGIASNQKFPARLMQNNLQISSNVIGSSHRHGVTKLLYLASSCVYPAQSPQPIKEEALLNGPLEATSEAYALAKIAGIKLCQAYSQEFGANFITAIPANIYGPGDDFSPEESHVIPGLIRRMHEAKTGSMDQVSVWGTGEARREFIYVDDVARATIHLMERDTGPNPVNVGSGEAVSIAELAGLVKRTVGYDGELSFDTTRPDGAPMKMLDSSEMRRQGWQPQTSLLDGLAQTYRWYLGYQQDEAESPPIRSGITVQRP